ncbi:hypothetical protein ANACOL_02232 [Anaerotruncus colihominis DSM 17241]|uniref:Uncharacterized protein n=1 Tax=Anaerotruncus colihominis DSM 17241 TaxID=445972 RepID=B0PBS4_9FIRM|nr:hypothetical protein ANACOL_02232 [Anaerotruncus colihominis DSM 17241]
MSDPAFLARVTRARVTAASSAMASDAFAGLDDLSQNTPACARKICAKQRRG